MAQSEVNFDKIVLIGGSAGSLEVLLQVLPVISTGKSYPVVIVLHRKLASDSPLIDLLAGRSLMPVKEIEEKETVLPGNVYIVPADYHLLFEKDGTFSLDVSEKVNYSRPSIDVVFESAAEVYENKVIGILLSGANADGTKGFEAIKELGGTTIVQEPGSAEISYMPEHAITSKVVDRILTIPQIAAYLNEL